jgi:hypothetical protein
MKDARVQYLRDAIEFICGGLYVKYDDAQRIMRYIDERSAPTRIEDMTNGNSAERDLYIQAMFDLIRDKNTDKFDDIARRVAWQSVESNEMSWRMWQARAALSVCIDGGKGEAVALPDEVRSALTHAAGGWRGAACGTRDDAEGERRSADYNRRAQVIEDWLAAPQAECAPRAPYGSGMIDAIEDFAPRADADTAGARDAQICAQTVIELRGMLLRLMKYEGMANDDSTNKMYQKTTGALFAASRINETAAGASNERADAEKDAALTPERVDEIANEHFIPSNNLTQHQWQSFARVIQAENKVVLTKGDREEALQRDYSEGGINERIAFRRGWDAAILAANKEK